ncbi:hypothetical protein ACTQ34_05460 [Agathobaculum sp. LCP25S3_E8]|uniref:hypothetical protein n=1 Tax=Agathobaculum sp. LCP25S3_E8 TaxID=3438735 RepID=UPI003F91E68B
MRKAFGLMAVLLFLGGAAMGWCVKTVYASHDQVQFTENVLAGDSAAADGLSIQMHATYGGQLFWDSTMLLQRDEPPITQTAYHFFNTEQEEESEESYRGIELYSDLGSSGSNFLDIPKNKRTGLDLAYQELYDSAKPGQEAQKTINVADYCKYYPLAGFISLKGIQQDFGIWSTTVPGYDASIQNKLEEFFRIPVLPNEKLTISLEKDSAGMVYSSGTNSNEGEQFNFYTQGIVTPETIYFSFNNRTNQNHIVDTSLIPGGYGIYAMNYTAGKVQHQGNAIQTLENGRLHLDSLQLVYPIDPKEEFLDLCQWSDGKTLLLYTRENNVYYLTVISMDTMQQIQRLVLQATQNGSGLLYLLPESKNFIVTIIDKTATVLLPDKDGKFHIDMQTTNTLDYQYLPRNIDSSAIDYQDGKLALAGESYDRYSGMMQTGFDVVVCDRNGLQLWAQYQSSLQNDLTGAYNTSEIVRLLYNHPIRVTWQ